MSEAGNNCYGDDLELTPDSGDLQGQVPSREPLTPDDFAADAIDSLPNVIKELYGNCYPDQAPKSVSSVEKLPPPPDGFDLNLDPLLNVFKTLITTELPPTPSSISVRFPNPKDPTSPNIIIDGGDIEGAKNDDWDKCVSDALNCMFKKYIGNTWKPAPVTCETFIAPKLYGNKDKVCVENCVPDRIPIYEYLKGGSPTSNVVQFNVCGRSSVTTNPDGTWNGKKIRRECGNTIFNSGVTRTWTASGAGVTVTINADPIDDNGEWDSNWWVSNVSGGGVVGDSFTASLNGGRGNVTVTFTLIAGVTSGTDHSYGTSPNPPAGYISLGISFYLLKEQVQGSVPLFKYYSFSREDTFLTTNPGEPDSPGAGERVTMDAAEMQFDEILGYVFPTPNDAVTHLANDEIIEPLHRYFQPYGPPTAFDHKYQLEYIGDNVSPKLSANGQYYHIPNEIYTNLFVGFDLHKGGAAYQNSLGVYLRNSSGVITFGRIIEAQATTSEGYTQTIIPISILRQNLNGRIGFFLISDGGNRGASDQQNVTFSFAGNGYVCDQVSSREGRVFFSESEINPNNKRYSVLKSDDWQWWEDLLNGDNDYDDTKAFYKMGWGDGVYRHEGIQCYVYRTQAPEKVYLTIQNKTDCDPRIFSTDLEPMQITRSGCGSSYQENNCGTCTGDYTVLQKNDQSLNIVNDGNISLRSYGGIFTRGGDCLIFTIRMYRNQTLVYEETHSGADWKTIGYKLSATIPVSAGDTLRIVIPEVLSGSFYSTSNLSISLFDEDLKMFEQVVPITITTLSLDKEQYPIPAAAPGSTTSVGGSILTFDIAIENDDVTTSWKPAWINGQKASNSEHILLRRGDMFRRMIFSDFQRGPSSMTGDWKKPKTLYEFLTQDISNTRQSIFGQDYDTFYHDFVLSRSGNARIRLKFKIIPKPTQQLLESFNITDPGYDGYAVVIDVVDVVNSGDGYSDDAEFSMIWPEAENDNREGTDLLNPPYYVNPSSLPETVSLPNVEINNYDVELQNSPIPVKMGFYQKSHDTQSLVWYLAFLDPQNRLRVKFKIKEVSS